MTGGADVRTAAWLLATLWVLLLDQEGGEDTQACLLEDKVASLRRRRGHTLHVGLGGLGGWVGGGEQEGQEGLAAAEAVQA